VDIGVVPTPLLYWSLSHLDVGAGIQITGSHNPPSTTGSRSVWGRSRCTGRSCRRSTAWR
jgi:phosphomannomutase/phosphoglucomutase